MKVGLISFHNAYNYGACLQAYALQEGLSGMGADCEYIDYINTRRAEGYRMSSRILKALKAKDIKGVVKNTCGAPFLWSRGSKFDKFYARYLKKTDKVYHTSDEAKVLNSRYDKFVVGSDQVWNAEHNGTDAAFFLSFVEDKRKTISYSSSFGMASIPEELKTWYVDNINQIACLSTREKCGVDLIEGLTGRHAHLVLDPVFLLNAEDWKKLINISSKLSRYTFYYMNARFNPEDFGRVTGWKDGERRILSASVSPKDFVKKGQKVTFAMAPEEFLQQIHSAELIVTTSFHCLAFSILFHKKFVAILSGDEGRDERLLNLLQITGLENRIFSRNMTLAEVNADIDYEKVEKRLDIYRDYSRAYLKAAVFEGNTAADNVVEPPYAKSESVEMTICAYDKCTGCGTCSLRCPKGAISMKGDIEGFLRPSIDERKCVKCGICGKVCQANIPVKPIVNQRYYALKQNETIRKRSSSGGAFRTLAYQMIEDGGIVVASEMGSDWKASHSIAKTVESVEKQGKTFYVQGNAFSRFKEVEAALSVGTKVLFVGTPCQISGLNHYLKEEYTNLLTCDILCHGVPSPKMFKVFIDYLKSKGNLQELKQRDKEIGWKGYCVSAVIDGKKYKNTGWLKGYGVMFSHALINRTSCYQCQYASYNRPSDITIGDYWGIENHHKELKDKLGVSLVLVNTEKGQAFFEKATSGTEKYELQQNETAQNSLKHPKKQPMRRIGCMKEMEMSYASAAKKYGEWNLKGYVKETIRRLFIV